MTIGERIRQLREEKDISLRELAREIGVSAAFLSDVELGRRYPSDKHLATIVRVLGTTRDDLRAYDTRPPMRDLRRMALSNPQYGLAFRQLIEGNISPQEILDFVNEHRKEDDEEAEDAQ